MSLSDDSYDLSSDFSIEKEGSKELTSSFTCRKSTSKNLSSSFQVRKVSTKNLQSSFDVRESVSNDMSSSLYVASNFKYKVARINNWVTEKSLSNSIKTLNAYTEVFDEDVPGYALHTITILAAAQNDITYKIEGYNADVDAWSPISNTAGVAQTDINVTKGTSVAVVFTGVYDRVRLWAKNKTGGQSSACVVGLNSILSGPMSVTITT